MKAKSYPTTNIWEVRTAEDLKPKPGINLNPPPDDGRCDKCGKHISELEPFKGSDVLLYKNFRSYVVAKSDDEEIVSNGASWECRDCFVLDNDEANKKYEEVFKKNVEESEKR